MESVIRFVKDDNGSSQVERVVEILCDRAVLKPNVRQLVNLIFEAFEFVRFVGAPEAERQYFVSSMHISGLYTIQMVKRLHCCASVFKPGGGTWPRIPENVH